MNLTAQDYANCLAGLRHRIDRLSDARNLETVPLIKDAYSREIHKLRLTEEKVSAITAKEFPK